MFMTPGLAFFYGGLVRAKNVLGTMMQSFIALLAAVTVAFVRRPYGDPEGRRRHHRPAHDRGA